MGKKRRILTNPKKFGKKHFEFLDNMDGTDDDIISSTKVSPTLRTLNLVDNGDRTVSLTAELFGSGSNINSLRYIFQVTGGVNLASTVIGDESISIGSAATTTGWPFASSNPALQDNSGNIFVLPEGKVTVKAIVHDSADWPGASTDATSQAATLIQSIDVGAAPIGLTASQLSGALAGALDGTEAITLDLAQMSGTAAQHGSGSGVGSTDPYGPDSGASAHGFKVVASGSTSGTVTMESLADSNNGHLNTGVVTIISQTNANGLGAEEVVVTFTPKDVNGALSTEEAVSHTLTFTA